MDHAFGSRGGPTAPPWAYSAGADRLGQSTVLVVEDDRDIREMLATLFDLAGFSTVTCDSAEAGLAALREREFDLVLTDYALPERTGVWLLRAAEEEGLITGTPVMIVTAHPSVEGADGYEIIQKPFDLDELIERAKLRMEGASRGQKRKLPSMDGDGGGVDGPDGDCPEPVELILYVSAHSPRSAAALRTIKEVLTRFGRSKVKLTVHDLATDPSAGVTDSVAFTPTLVRKKPGPRTFILGHITNPELLLELLGDCEPES